MATYIGGINLSSGFSYQAPEFLDSRNKVD